MTKRWKVDEIALVCKAYISATNNPINGTDQDFHNFSPDLVDRFNHISPSDCVDGTYYTITKVTIQTNGSFISLICICRNFQNLLVYVQLQL